MKYHLRVSVWLCLLIRLSSVTNIASSYKSYWNSIPLTKQVTMENIIKKKLKCNKNIIMNKIKHILGWRKKYNIFRTWQAVYQKKSRTCTEDY